MRITDWSSECALPIFGPDQLDLPVAIRRVALYPVVVDLGALVAHAHQDPTGRAVNVVVLHAEDRTGVRDLVRLHVDRMPARAVTRIEDLAVLERERSGVVVGAQDPVRRAVADDGVADGDVRSEEHTSELQSLMRISYAVFCLKKKT